MTRSEINASLFQKAQVSAAEKERIAAPASGIVKDAWLRLRKNRAAVVSLFVLIAIILLAIFAPIFSQYSFKETDYSMVFATPSAQHIFGADQFGRDLWVRTWMGTRISLLIARKRRCWRSRSPSMRSFPIRISTLTAGKAVPAAENPPEWRR